MPGESCCVPFETGLEWRQLELGLQGGVYAVSFPTFSSFWRRSDILLGLGVRLIKGGFLGDPVFFWRGSVALLAVSIAITLIQIRNK